MAGNARDVELDIVGVDKTKKATTSAGTNLDRLKTKTDAAGNSAKGMSGKWKAAGVAVAAAALKIGHDAVKNASDAQQSIGATATIFGKHAGEINKNAKGAADKYGLSANQYRTSADLIASLLKNQGVASDKLAGKTDGLVKKGSDLAAVFGGSTADAVDALGSSLKGEFDPLEKYGITLNQSSINAEALRQAHVKNVAQFNKLTPAAQKQAKQQATLALIDKQSAAASGQFTAQKSTEAEQAQIAAAKYTNLTTTLGTKLIPVVSTLLGWGIKILDWLSGMGTTGKVVVGVIAGFVAVIATVVQLTKVWTTVQAALDVVMTANPIGLIIVAIAAFVIAIVIAYKKSETFRAIVSGAFHGIAVAVKAVVSAIKTAWSKVHDYVINPVKNAAVWVAGKIAAIPGWFGKIGGKIKGALSDVGSAITSPFRAAFNAIAGLWNNTIGRVSFHIPGWVPKVGGNGFSFPQMPTFSNDSGLQISDGSFLSRVGGPTPLSVMAGPTNVTTRVYIDGQELRALVRSQVSAQINSNNHRARTGLR